jgi:hypothetical protein
MHLKKTSDLQCVLRVCDQVYMFHFFGDATRSQQNRNKKKGDDSHRYKLGMVENSPNYYSLCLII